MLLAYFDVVAIIVQMCIVVVSGKTGAIDFLTDLHQLGNCNITIVIFLVWNNT